MAREGGGSDERSTTAPVDRVRVLVVTGNDERGASLRSSLEATPEPLAVAVETDGSRALERIEADRVDCVVCASRSVARNGGSVLEAIADRRPRLPFVLLDDGGRIGPDAALEAGATDCVRTPITDDRAALVARRLRNYGERYAAERGRRGGAARRSSSSSDFDVDFGSGLDSDRAPAGDCADAARTGLDPDGPDVDANANANADADADGSPLEDRTSTALLRALSAAFPDIALLLDEDGRYLDVYAGPDTEALLVDDRETLVGRTVFDVLPSAEASRVMDGITAALETGGVETIEYQLDVPAGDRWFEGRIAPLGDRVDGAAAVVMIVRDVTTRKETELKLRERESHLTQAQSIADLGSWRLELDREAIVDVEWSEEVYRIFGYPVGKEITFEHFRDRVHPEDWDHVDREWNAATERGSLDTEYRIVVDGETKWVRQKAEIEFDEEGTPVQVIGVMQDITERKRHARQLEFQNQQLEVFNRIIRHDIRNQLNIVAGYASLLTETERVDDGESIAAQIREAADELLAVSEEIREVNRLVSGGTEYRPVRLETLLRDVLASVRSAYSDLDFECETSIAESLWVFECDGLEIALENVVENAIEHNDADRPRVEITAEECAESAAVDVRIADNGPGIPEPEREILTGDRERTQLEHTSGLGLWTVNWIVAAVGGDLEFETRPDGTVVRIRLPRADPPEQQLRP